MNGSICNGTNTRKVINFHEESSSSEEEEELSEEVLENRRRLRSEDEREKTELLKSIEHSEVVSHMNFVRRQSSGETALKRLNQIYSSAEKEVGYRVDVWPPVPTSSNLHLENINLKVPNFDRAEYVKQHVISYCERAAQNGEETFGSIVIVAESDDVIDRINDLPYFASYPVVVIKESDLTPERREYLNFQISAFEDHRAEAMMLCHQKLISHSYVPFGKLNIFHKVTDKEIFNKFVRGVTINSRLHKQKSDIYVPLDDFDKPEIIEYAAMLVGLRGEEVSNSVLDFVEKQCWSDKPSERGSFEKWSEDVQNANKDEENEVRKFLGIRVEFWWNNNETMKRVIANVRPMKETAEHPIERPWQGRY